MMNASEATQSTTGTLRRCELLAPLGDELIEALAARAGRRALREGEALFRQDEESRYLFVVQEGELSIRLKSPGGEQIGWFVAGKYALMGWSAFLSPPVYVADAHAVEDHTSVLVIEAGEAEEIMLRDPAAAYQVMKRIAGQISTRLRDLREEFVEVVGAR